jgi:dienelactone hydrolase
MSQGFINVFAIFILFLSADPKVLPANPPLTGIDLPKPTGKYKVGTVVHYWVDEKREEQWTKVQGDFRRLIVQIWYPSDKANEKYKAPYVFDLEKLRKSIEKYRDNAGSVQTSASIGVSLSTAEKKYPVIIFSHGMNSSRFTYTAICQELASQGYVVAAIDHPYWGPGSAFPDGKLVAIEEGIIGRDKLSPDDLDRIMQEGITVMAADQAFVVERLAELNKTDAKLFKNRLNLSQIGSMGHSMGGMAATRACLEYTAFKACLSLDGPNYFLNMMPEPSPKPFLLLLNSEWGRKAPPRIKKSYLEAWADPAVAIINGTKHNSYSDFYLISPPESQKAPLEPLKAHRIICASIVSFLARHLKQQPVTEPQFPELEWIDLKSLIESK